MDMITRTGFSLLAEVLEYPGDELTASCRSLIGELGEGRGEAQQAIEEFLTSTESLSTSRLQEVYAGTFDVNPACCLYAAYHLHGDSYKRGAFMAGLNREYRERGFESGNDLPDHLPVMFRFLSQLDDPELASGLLVHAILPALAHIVRAFEVTDNVYAKLLQAVLHALKPDDYVTPESVARELPLLDRDATQLRRATHV
jgi:nitrate reductase molybdenum cofactor assembly chaperone